MKNFEVVKILKKRGYYDLITISNAFSRQNGVRAEFAYCTCYSSRHKSLEFSTGQRKKLSGFSISPIGFV